MFAPGTCLLGKYRIERVLGEGGMGHVVLAQHLELEQPVAIKVLLPELVRKQDIVDRFLREARAAVRLRGEHITRVYDVGRLDDGTPFLVMEYLEGRDLSALTRERGRLPGDEAVDYLLQACEALAEAHAQGMVHRDIKPSNLFIVRGPAGQPLLKVLDFGIAKAPTDLDHGATSTQAVLGTPAYMSPEQMRSSKYVDARTDIWSLGVVLYELVSGVRPFQADSFASLCLKVAMEPTPPIDPALIPTGLAAVIERCLEKDYGRRYQNVAELAAALAAFSRSPGDAARCVERATHTLGLAAVPIEPAPAGVGATAPTPRVGPSPTAPPPPRPTPGAAAPLTPL
uniref:serine/threonine-protein kinase n=1 Tax=Haliangium sp. TaxID=2663208 RepID=UPI003D0C1DC7